MNAIDGSHSLLSKAAQCLKDNAFLVRGLASQCRVPMLICAHTNASNHPLCFPLSIIYRRTLKTLKVRRAMYAKWPISSQHHPNVNFTSFSLPKSSSSSSAQALCSICNPGMFVRALLGIVEEYRRGDFGGVGASVVGSRSGEGI